MDDNKIPYIAFESAIAKEERTTRRLSNIIIVVLVLWFMTIAGFIWYITLPVEETSQEITQTVDDIKESEVTQSVGE